MFMLRYRQTLDSVIGMGPLSEKGLWKAGRPRSNSIYYFKWNVIILWVEMHWRLAIKHEHLAEVTLQPPLERMDHNFLVLGCGRRWRERKKERLGDERMRGALSPGRWWPIPDHLPSCQGQAINAALLWLPQTAWGYSRPADSVRLQEHCTKQRGDSSDEGSSLGHIVNIHSRYKHQKK